MLTYSPAGKLSSACQHPDNFQNPDPGGGAVHPIMAGAREQKLTFQIDSCATAGGHRKKWSPSESMLPFSQTPSGNSQNLFSRRLRLATPPPVPNPPTHYFKKKTHNPSTGGQPTRPPPKTTPIDPGKKISGPAFGKAGLTYGAPHPGRGGGGYPPTLDNPPNPPRDGITQVLSESMVERLWGEM